MTKHRPVTKYHTDVCTATRVPPRALARSLLVASGPCEPANAVRTGERETGSCEEGRSKNQLAPKSNVCVLVAACVTHRIVSHRIVSSCDTHRVDTVTSSTLVRLLVEVGTITTDKRGRRREN